MAGTIHPVSSECSTKTTLVWRSTDPLPVKITCRTCEDDSLDVPLWRFSALSATNGLVNARV